jgi:hypothetical protein
VATSPNLSELITTTLRNRTGKLADNVTKSRALLTRLRAKGNSRPAAGGRTLVQELEYAENGTFKRYSGYDLLNISPSDVMTAAEFDWKQAAVAVSMNGLEQLQNNGKAVVIDMLAQRIKNAEKTLINNIGSDCFSDGTADGGRQIGGLQLLVSSTPTTGTVGGINAATWAFWRNVKFSGVTDGGAAVTAANIQSYMNQLAIKLVRGTDAADLIVSDDNYYNLYLSSLQAIQRVTDEKMAGAGFSSLKYYGAGMSSDVVLERSSGLYANAGMPANTMYFLNTDYVYFRPHSERNFSVGSDERQNANQDAFVKLILWAGNMTISNRALQGILVA